MIRRIEKLSLVGFEYEQSKRIIEEAITFTERLRTTYVDETVRPMYSTLENEYIYLQDDEQQDHINHHDILKNAAVLEDGYFVAPLVTKPNSE
jgi:Asp-tRNA(Asn)/Glu-tRNA(Gln) amidotransferase C subunit